MKPLKVEFQAFGPYAGLECVDFEKLADKGLFLICGETGSGKTMLLDAITFALYGKSSGHTRDSFENMRCTSADFEVTTFVKFIFEVSGDKYLFERRLERKRKNLSPLYNLMKMDENGDWIALLENPKERDLNTKAVELIGLEYDQFRQVIILPQGQFEELLTSNSDKKEIVLSNIFGEERWQIIAEKFYEEAARNKESLSKIRDKIVASLIEEECETISELEEKVLIQKDELCKLDLKYKDSAHEEQIERLQGLLAISKRFEDLRKLLLDRKNHLDGATIRKQYEERLGLARRAEKVRGFIDNQDKCEKAFASRKVSLEEAINSEAALKQTITEEECKLKSHTEKEPAIEEKKRQVIIFADKKDDYATIYQVETRIRDKEAECNKAKKEFDACKKANEQIEKEIVRIRDEWTELEREYEALLNAYISGISGNLAKELKEGEACPVCGSTSHPHKAELIDDNVNKESVDVKKAEADKKQALLDEVLRKQKEYSLELQQKQNKVNELSVELAGIKSEYDSKKASLIDGIDTLAELESSIKDLNSEIDVFYAKKQELEVNHKKLSEECITIASRIESFKEEVANAEKELQSTRDLLLEQLRINDFKTRENASEGLLSQEEMEELQRLISEYDAKTVTLDDQIDEMQKELEEINEPNAEQVSEELRNRQAAIKEYSNKKGALELEYNRLLAKLNNLKKESNGLEDKFKEAEEDFVFAKKLRGDSGTGIQRYVLGIMFSSVIAAANKMLELVHDGRYRLYRTDDKSQGSNKRGLELKVIDKYSDDPNGRFVNTLSGGEKFLASLALSIGMSSIAQKSGIKIEALFIDEGFGSLDDNSIVDAMNILNSIQKASGLVGIISHVQLLEDRIPTKLIVNKSEGRSHITQSIG